MYEHARVIHHLAVAAATAGRTRRQPEVRDALIEALFHLRRQHWIDTGRASLAADWWPD